MKTEEDTSFRRDAKVIVDLCHDSKLFKDHLTRDDMNCFEDFITFVLQSRFDSHIKMHNLLERIEQGKQKRESGQ